MVSRPSQAWLDDLAQLPQLELLKLEVSCDFSLYTQPPWQPPTLALPLLPALTHLHLLVEDQTVLNLYMQHLPALRSLKLEGSGRVVLSAQPPATSAGTASGGSSSSERAGTAAQLEHLDLALSSLSVDFGAMPALRVLVLGPDVQALDGHTSTGAATALTQLRLGFRMAAAPGLQDCCAVLPPRCAPWRSEAAAWAQRAWLWAP